MAILVMENTSETAIGLLMSYAMLEIRLQIICSLVLSADSDCIYMEMMF